MATVEVNGTTLYYEETGQGTPIVFVHGMCGHANGWDGQVGRLSDEFRCVAYDRRGHTRSPFSNGGYAPVRTVELHADDAAGLIRALGLAPCMLVGSSGGAVIGVDLVRRYPELFVGAVLSEPPLLALDLEAARPFMSEVQSRVTAAMASHRSEDLVDAFFGYVCPGLWNAIDESKRETYRANHVELLGELQGVPYVLTTADLEQVRVPCLVVVGEKTLPIFRRVATLVAESVPGAELVEIPGSGHVTYAESPEVFAAAVRRFARSLAGRPPASESRERSRAKV
jgi:3-oxoadipate enol-lactonase